ncbi:potassium-transporting ATPase subunit F [Sinomonas susongensis]|nr:potassium-transporting ATPase subunit F [Sinomonas susongensis]
MSGDVITWALLGVLALALCVYLVDQLFRPGGK